MTAVRESINFEALDECHRQMQLHLAGLSALAQRLATSDADAEARSQAAGIEAYFSSNAREHHLEEEKNVFPLALASGNPALESAVHSLQQDHGWIEENWIELAPQLRAIASGNSWFDPAEFQHGAEVFHDLCLGHIALEESLVYPESKARWAQAVASRVPQPAR